MRNLILIFLILFQLPSFAQIKVPEFEKTIEFCIKKLKEIAKEIPDSLYPLRTKGLGEWELTPPTYWTSGFFPGSLWLGFLLIEDSTLLTEAKKFTHGLTEQQYNTHTHDVGFMMFNSFGNGYKISGNEEYKKIVLQSAKSLASRFNEKVGAIQSWDGDFQVIVDNMMNLELLFWASKNGGEKNLYNIAVKHAYKTIDEHLRKDGGSFHVVHYNSETGELIKKRTHQGYTDSSTWARGQAWGIYGFTMSFRETKDTTFLKTAIKMADFFMKNLPEDFIPYWDFNLPENSDRKYRDASAAAIALSAFLELRNYVDEKSKYDKVINGIFNSLINKYLSAGTESRGILIHNAYNVNSKNSYDWDASTVWGDYYFLESLLRYKNLN